MRCRICGGPSYSDLCPDCRNKGKTQTPESAIWYMRILDHELYKEYNSTEISEAFEICFYTMKNTNCTTEERRKMYRMRFGKLLQMAWEKEAVPGFFEMCLKDIKERAIKSGGNGTEILKTLGLMPAEAR